MSQRLHCSAEDCEKTDEPTMGMLDSTEDYTMETPSKNIIFTSEESSSIIMEVATSPSTQTDTPVLTKPSS